MGTRRKLKFPVLGKSWYSGWQRSGISSQGDLHSGVKQSLEVPLTNGRSRPVLRSVRICQHFLGVKRTAPALQESRIDRLSKKGFFHPGRMLREDVIRIVKFERWDVGDSPSPLSKRDLNARGEQKARNAFKYLVRWEVVKLTQPRKKSISSEQNLPQNPPEPQAANCASTGS